MLSRFASAYVRWQARLGGELAQRLKEAKLEGLMQVVSEGIGMLSEQKAPTPMTAAPAAICFFAGASW